MLRLWNKQSTHCLLLHPMQLFGVHVPQPTNQQCRDAFATRMSIEVTHINTLTRLRRRRRRRRIHRNYCTVHTLCQPASSRVGVYRGGRAVIINWRIAMRKHARAWIKSAQSFAFNVCCACAFVRPQYHRHYVDKFPEYRINVSYCICCRFACSLRRCCCCCC